MLKTIKLCETCELAYDINFSNDNSDRNNEIKDIKGYCDNHKKKGK